VVVIEAEPEVARHRTDHPAYRPGVRLPKNPVGVVVTVASRNSYLVVLSATSSLSDVSADRVVT
jgi:hypothetical protein